MHNRTLLPRAFERNTVQYHIKYAIHQPAQGRELSGVSTHVVHMRMRTGNHKLTVFFTVPVVSLVREP